MARNPALNEKRFEDVREEWEPGWAAPAPPGATAAEGASQQPPAVRTGVMTANGTFAKTFVLFLRALSKAFEVQWNGIVFQAVLATVGVFFATLALYVFGIVKVTKRFTMV